MNMQKTMMWTCLAALAACSTKTPDDGRTGAARAAQTQTAALKTGFVPAAPESAARGAPAIALDPTGRILVLDAVQARVARVDGQELVTVAQVPGDADDLAVGPDGAIAVLRSAKPEVLVFDAKGARIGTVDVSAVSNASAIDGIVLAQSRRVLVTTSFQETFSIGSPSMPQLPAAILASKREGAAMLGDGRGVVAVRTSDGRIELRTRDAAYSLGRADAARIIGASGDVVCVRLERVSQDGTGLVRTSREASCADMRAQKTVFHADLPPPGAYVPRRELAFSGRTLAFAHVDQTGLSVTTWTVEGGVQ